MAFKKGDSVVGTHRGYNMAGVGVRCIVIHGPNEVEGHTGLVPQTGSKYDEGDMLVRISDGVYIAQYWVQPRYFKAEEPTDGSDEYGL